MNLPWLVGWTQDGTLKIVQETQEPKGFRIYSRREEWLDAVSDLEVVNFEETYGEEK